MWTIIIKFSKFYTPLTLLLLIGSAPLYAAQTETSQQALEQLRILQQRLSSNDPNAKPNPAAGQALTGQPQPTSTVERGQPQSQVPPPPFLARIVPLRLQT